jgi:regulator of sigma D
MPYVPNHGGHLDIRNSVCIHIKAICHLLLHYDFVHGIAPEIQEHTNSMSDHTYEVLCRNMLSLFIGFFYIYLLQVVEGFILP